MRNDETSPDNSQFLAAILLENIFKEASDISKEPRNHLILRTHDIHAYTQREIGEYLGLHPGYISNIVLKCRKN